VPTEELATAEPPTEVPTEEPPTEEPPTEEPPTEEPIPTIEALPVAAAVDWVGDGSAWVVVDDDPTTAWYTVAPAAVEPAPVVEEPAPALVGEGTPEGEAAFAEELPVEDVPTEPIEVYVGVDLGDVYDIGTVRWLWAELGEDDAPDYVEVEISVDGEEWLPVLYPDQATELAGEWQEGAVYAPARYVRFLYPDPTPGTLLGGLAELEVLPPA